MTQKVFRKSTDTSRVAGAARQRQGRRMRWVGWFLAVLSAGAGAVHGQEPAQKPPRSSPKTSKKSRPQRAAPAPGRQLADVIEESLSSVVLIETKDDEGEERGVGSGFVVNEAGLIATNSHVIAGASSAVVRFTDDEELAVAGVVALDEDGDLAILELEKKPSDKRPLPLAGKIAPRRGENVFALGNPQGLRFTATTGIVSATHRTDKLPEQFREYLSARDDYVWIQTSAPISPGNSGGPLLNDAGTVIGVNTWVAAGENLGFAAHAWHLTELLQNLQKAIPLATLAEPQVKFAKLVEEYEGDEGRPFLFPNMRMFIGRESSRNQLPMAEKFLQLCETYPKSSVAMQALSLAVFAAAESDRPSRKSQALQERGADWLWSHQAKNNRTRWLLLQLAMFQRKGAAPFLRRVSSLADGDTKLLAEVALLGALQPDDSLDGDTDDEFRERLESLDPLAGKVKVRGLPLSKLIEPLRKKSATLMGQRPPDITGRDLSGKEHSLADLKGRVVLIAFVDGNDRDQLELVKACEGQLTRHQARGLSLIVVPKAGSRRIQPSGDLGRAAEGPPAMLVTADEEATRTAKAWRIDHFPELFILDRDGNLRQRQCFGARLSAATRELLPLPIEPVPQVAPSGVTAQKIVLINQHNSDARDRGAKTARIELFLAGKSQWMSPPIEMKWDRDNDPATEVEPPSKPFDRVRVWVDSWEGAGGGLSEVQVLRDGVNLARGCPAWASDSFDIRFPPDRVTDGDNSQFNCTGYWLLPQQTAGWVEVDLTHADAAPDKALKADRIVLWNQHNGPDHNGGSASCKVGLWLRGQEVWNASQPLPWQANTDSHVELALPDQEFDTVRVDVEAMEGKHAGLAEIQVFRGSENLAQGVGVRSNHWHSAPYHARKAVDGVTSSAEHEVGYWVCEHRSRPRVELLLAAAHTSLGALYRRTAFDCLAKGEIQLALAWFERCDHAALRDAAYIETPPDHPNSLVMRAGTWWGLSNQAPSSEQTLLRLLAAYNYRRVLGVYDSDMNAFVVRRLRRALAQLPEEHAPYFWVETAGPQTTAWRTQTFFVGGSPQRLPLLGAPSDQGEERLEYRLDQEYRAIQGRVAIDERTQAATVGPIKCTIRVDGKDVWTSEDLSKPGQFQDFQVVIAGTQTLELNMSSATPITGFEAAWLDVRLTPTEDEK